MKVPSCILLGLIVLTDGSKGNPTFIVRNKLSNASTNYTPLKQSSSLDIRGGASKDTTIQKEDEGKSSVMTTIFNLANNVAGAGILTLAAGKASGTGWIPSILTRMTLAFMSAHTFILIGKACEMTGEKTFKGLWAGAFG